MEDASWRRVILRFALRATAASEAPWLQYERIRTTGREGNLPDTDDPGKDPRFRKLVEAILYGREFMKTYNLVLLVVLLVFTAWHWGQKLNLYREERKRDISYRKSGNRDSSEEEEEAWSSSSSTIEGSMTPPEAAKRVKANVEDERTPLLSTKRPRRTGSSIWRSYYVLRSILQYQPPPIPVVNKVLPTNAVSILVLAWLGLVLFYNFYRMPLSFLYLFIFADRCGIIFISNLPLLYLLAAKNQPIKFLTGYSYESLNIFHRRVGEAMCFEALLHFLGMFAVWYGMLRHLGFTLTRFIFNRVVLLGLAAFIAYELIYFTSLRSFRQRWYEIFLVLHIVLQVAGLGFLWFHHSSSRPYVGISLVIFLVDRLVYRAWLKSSTHPASLTLLEDDETILLSANWETSEKNSLMPANMKFGWRPNEHIFLSVPALSRKHSIQAHPFTIFSAAPTTSHDAQRNHAWFSLLIRAQGKSGFANQLLRYACQHSQTRIRLDGPYGSSHALDTLKVSTTSVLVVGGSGIAVAYPLIYSLLQPTSSSDNESALATRVSFRKVKLLWITHSPNHRLWISDDKMRELQDWGLDLLIPPPTALAGRPNVGVILQDWLCSEASRASVVVSGPDGLVRDVRNACARLLCKGINVSVEVEKFGW